MTVARLIESLQLNRAGIVAVRAGEIASLITQALEAGGPDAKPGTDPPKHTA